MRRRGFLFCAHSSVWQHANIVLRCVKRASFYVSPPDYASIVHMEELSHTPTTTYGLDEESG